MATAGSGAHTRQRFEPAVWRMNTSSMSKCAGEPCALGGVRNSAAVVGTPVQRSTSAASAVTGGQDFSTELRTTVARMSWYSCSAALSSLVLPAEAGVPKRPSSATRALRPSSNSALASSSSTAASSPRIRGGPPRTCTGSRSQLRAQNAAGIRSGPAALLLSSVLATVASGASPDHGSLSVW